jgi:hypothetical protein
MCDFRCWHKADMRRRNLKSAFEIRTDEACRRRVLAAPASLKLILAYTENLSEISSLNRHHHWAFNRGLVY